MLTVVVAVNNDCTLDHAEMVSWHLCTWEHVVMDGGAAMRAEGNGK